MDFPQEEDHPVLGETVETRAHTTLDGMLHLTLNVGMPDAEVAVSVRRVSPLASSETVDSNGWPMGYFDRVAGSMPDLERAPQGQFEQRVPLE